MDKPPPNRRKFFSPWDEILYLYNKGMYWLYNRRIHSRSMIYCNRLERLLLRHANSHESIKGEECWAFLCQARGQMREAIRYRKSEIRLRKRLLKMQPLIHGYKPDNLADSLDMLAMLYHDVGNIKRAIAILLESRSVSENAGIPFAGKKLLMDFTKELTATQ